MEDKGMRIGQLSKTTVRFRNPRSESERVHRFGEKLTFIFGVGPHGLTPFEFELAGKAAGEDLQLDIPQEDLHEFFGHLWTVMAPALQDTASKGLLRVDIEDVQESDQREIIRAMAETSRCEDHCCGH